MFSRLFSLRSSLALPALLRPTAPRFLQFRPVFTTGLSNDSKIDDALSLLNSRGDTMPSLEQLLQTLRHFMTINKTNRILQITRALFLHLSTSYPHSLTDPSVYEQLLIVCLSNMSSRECLISFVHLLMMLGVPINEKFAPQDLGQATSVTFAPVFVRIMLDMYNRLGTTPLNFPSVMRLLFVRLSFYNQDSVRLFKYMDPLIELGLHKDCISTCSLSALFQLRRTSDPELPSFYDHLEKLGHNQSKSHLCLFFYYLDRQRLSDKSSVLYLDKAMEIADKILKLYPNNENLLIDLLKGYAFLLGVPEYREHCLGQIVRLRAHYLTHFPDQNVKLMSIILFMFTRLRPIDSILDSFIKDYFFVKNPNTGNIVPEHPSYYSCLLFAYYPDIKAIYNIFGTATREDLLQDRKFLVNLIRMYLETIHDPKFKFINEFLFNLVCPSRIEITSDFAKIAYKINPNIGTILQLIHDQQIPLGSSTYYHIARLAYVLWRTQIVVEMTKYCIQAGQMEAFLTGRSFGYIALSLLLHHEWHTLIDVIRFSRDSKFAVNVNPRISYAQTLFDDYPRLRRIISRCKRVFSNLEPISTLMEHIKIQDPDTYSYWTSDNPDYNSVRPFIKIPSLSSDKVSPIYNVGQLREWVEWNSHYLPFANNDADVPHLPTNDMVKYFMPLFKAIQVPDVFMEHHIAVKRSLFPDGNNKTYD